jgi:hypothetical protein
MVNCITETSCHRVKNFDILRGLRVGSLLHSNPISDTTEELHLFHQVNLFQGAP